MTLNLQSPKGKNLPDFFGEVRPERIKIELDQHVKSLINCHLLLDKSLNILLNELLSLSIEIEKVMELLSREAKDIILDPEKIKKKTIDIVMEYAKKRERKLTEVEIEGHIGEAFEKARVEFVNEEHALLLEKLGKVNNDIQNKLSDYCADKKILLDIVDRTSLFLCNECGKIYCKDIFQKGNCDCKKKISIVEQTKQITVAHVGKVVRSFVIQNMWLEYGVNKLFEKTDYKTACGAHVIGSSGVKHEVDLVCENPKSLKRILVECKNKDLTLNEVFILYGKMSDLGCNYGVIITTGTASHQNVIRMAQSKNIIVVEKILEQNLNDALTKIS